MEKKKLNILIVDIWAEQGTNLYRYASGLAAGASKFANVTLAAPYSYRKPPEHNYRLINTFFPFTAKMKKHGFVRRVIRGAEYIHGYRRLARIARKERFDIIQIEWPLRYKLDARLYRKLKEGCKVFVYKAHNVLPHSTGEKFLEDMRVIYDMADVILIHGRNHIEKEFLEYYPEFQDKLLVQRHGVNDPRELRYDISEVNPTLVQRIREVNGNTKKIYAFFGDIHEDKGLDRLVKIWLEEFRDSGSLLVVAGRILGEYPAFRSLEPAMKECSNLLYLPGYIYENDVNFLMESCDMVVLPYRRAYMSGVTYTCAEFGRTLLATDWGALKEYADNEKDVFIVDNEDQPLREKLIEIDHNVSKERLREMGSSLKEHFYRDYRWSTIEKDVIRAYEEKVREAEQANHEGK